MPPWVRDDSLKPALARSAGIRKSICRATILFLAQVCATVGCSGGEDSGNGPDPDEPAYIVITPSDFIRIPQGLEITVNLVVRNAALEDLPDAPLQVSTSDPRIVVSTGPRTLRSLGPDGTAQVTFISGSISRSILVLILPHLFRLEMVPDSAQLNPGETVDLDVWQFDVNGNSMVLPTTWRSQDTSIARVSIGGRVTARPKEGVTYVFAQVDTLSIAARIRVQWRPAAIALTDSFFTLPFLDTLRLHAAVLDPYGETIPNAYPAFGSTDSSRFTVSSTGLVTAVDSGAAGILASVDTLIRLVGVYSGPATPAADLGNAQADLSQVLIGIGAIGGDEFLATSFSDGTVSRGSFASQALGPPIAVGGEPLDVAADTLAGIAFLAVRNPNELVVFDLVGDSVRDRLPIGSVGAVHVVALSADRSVAAVGTDVSIVGVDAVTLQVLWTVAGYVNGLVAHPTQSRFYGPSDAGILEIDAATGAVLRTMPAGYANQGMAISPDGTELYAADQSGRLRVLNLNSGTEIQAVVFDSPNDVALDPVSDRLMVLAGGAAYILDRPSRAILGVIDLDWGFFRVVARPAGGTFVGTVAGLPGVVASEVRFTQ